MRIKAGMVKDTLSATLRTSQKVCYEEAVKTLNTLQTNATVLQEIKKRGQVSHSVQFKNIDDTTKYLARTGISLQRLDELSVIHVAGTKGKGSTCAFCESILRHHGYKTGFYSSPHLVAVRERIRINGRPLSKTDFTKHFWNVYETLNEQKQSKDDMPPYFKFLTVMAFNVFISEKVDVAIIEVGIGGEYDCTNLLRKVPVVGITSLGIDHVNVLGHTIEEIAWQKAGIMKPGCIAFTTQGQPKEALKVLKERALEKQCELFVAPPLKSYDWDSVSLELGESMTNQTLNASLALQLANTWISLTSSTKSKHLTTESYKVPVINDNSDLLKTAMPFPITPKMALGVQLCSWPGRTHVVEKDGVYFFLDGAHTEESMAMCTKWFREASQELAYEYPVCRILMFNATGDRDISLLLKPLIGCNFNYVVFCPNIASKEVDLSSDQANFMVTTKQMMDRCMKNVNIWNSLKNAPDTELSRTSSETVLQFQYVSDVLEYINKLAGTKHGNDDIRYHVLITGSLHLVGCVLSIIDPELSAVNHHLPLKNKVKNVSSDNAVS